MKIYSELEELYFKVCFGLIVFFGVVLLLRRML